MRTLAVNPDTLPVEYREIYNNFIMPVDTDIKITSVILSDENTSKISMFLKELEFRDRILSFGLQPMNRILMYGASGTGKTYLSKALSNYLGYTMLYIDIARALTDDTVSKNVSEIFRLANYLGNCILMLDECDAIAWQRDTGNSDTGTIRRATNTVFQQLDQMNPTNVFIAATNMLHRLDAAFERRFNMKMEFKKPDIGIKNAVKHFLHKEFLLIDDVNHTVEEIVEKRAKQYAKLSYYEIQGIVERAMKDSIITDGDKLRVHTAYIYDQLATAMRVKLKFNAVDDDPISEPYT